MFSLSRLFNFRSLPPAALLAGAAMIAGGLAWRSVSGGGLIGGCGAAGGCSEVMQSRFSVVMGLPVAVLGLGLYAATLGAVLLRREKTAVLGSLGILAGAVWFVAVQALLVKAWCPWCCAAHGLASSAALLLISPFWPKSGFRRPKTTVLTNSITFAALTALLAAAQLLGPAPVTSRFQTAAAATADRSSGGPAKALLEIGENGRLSLFGGKVTVDAKKVPVLGSAFFFSPAQAVRNPLDALMAPQPVLLLSDWTCPHCRELLGRIARLKRPAGAVPAPAAAEKSELAKAFENTTIILLPAWRDEAGRELHSLMLSAWLGGGTLAGTLQEALAEGSVPATAEALNAKAAALLGADKWETHKKQTIPQVAEILATGGEVLGESDATLENATLPRLISAAGTLQGTPSDADFAAFLNGSGAALAARVSDVRQEAAPNGSRIRFESTAVETAPAPFGGAATAEFHFSNTGTEPLRLVSIHTTCACAVPDGWKQTVPPGGKGSFSVKVDTTGHHGSMSRQITLLVNASNAPAGGLIPLRVTVPILPAAASGNTALSSPGEPPLPAIPRRRVN
ncbi:MAG: DUF1573 domain-containing protein [Verrucomicrobiota bacterium]